MFGLKSSPSHSDPWPLKFKRHNLDAYCYNTLRCSVIYDRFQFSSKVEEPSGPPPSRITDPDGAGPTSLVTSSRAR